MQILSGARVFDGVRLFDNHVVVIEGGKIVSVGKDHASLKGHRVVLKGGVLAPALIDLQVNGGAGLMVDGQTDFNILNKVCATHLRLGSAGILPTLITDTAASTASVIAAGIAAAKSGMAGFLGLHLEGPHLDPRRKGAHDPNLIRPMTADDLNLLCNAAANLPALMITLAPESANNDQITALTRAGAVVSLGHSDCSYDTAKAAIAAGAKCATHLFNAMSQLGNREPGLVGAVLDGNAAAGLIADGIHVNAATVRIALAAKAEGLFLVSDCMAFAGTDLQEITLNGRQIHRNAGRLTLQDGTLAGADLTLPQAIKILVHTVGTAPTRALAMATSTPAAVIGANGSYGYLAPGRAAHLVHFDTNWDLSAVWHSGERLLT
jgi:N-acetylglucosamine-6-phosphate deacetylase